MKRLFLDRNGHLRNGWWIVIFLVLLVASGFVYTPVSRALQESGVPLSALDPLRLAFVLGVTWVCLRLRREPLSSVGFVFDRRWLRELGIGSALGIGTAALVVALIWMAGGVALEPNPARSLQLLVQGIALFGFVALFEETLFRGFVFQRLVSGIGVWGAQIILGLIFAAGHWDNPHMQGTAAIVATLELFLGAVLLGLAYLRTRSLALPVGIHLGWNWTHGYVFGFGVSGFDHPGWFRQTLQGLPEWMSGGQFGPEASIFALAVDALVIVLLWRWKGSAPPAAVANAAGPDAPALALART